MPSKRETAIQALADALLATGAEVWRATDLARAIPPAGLIEVAEGEAASEISISPVRYHVNQAAELRVAVTADDELAAAASLDALLIRINATLVADRSLGGATETLDLGEPSFEALEVDGAGRVAMVPVRLFFTATASPIA